MSLLEEADNIQSSTSVALTSMIVYSWFIKTCFGHWELGTTKLLFNGHSGKSLHCSVCPNAQFPKEKATFIESAWYIYIYLLANTQWQRHDSLKLFWQESKTQEKAIRKKKKKERKKPLQFIFSAFDTVIVSSWKFLKQKLIVFSFSFVFKIYLLFNLLASS